MIRRFRRGSGASTESSYERRIVLVGKTGVGKSATGNTILDREAFKAELSPASQTSECKKAKGEVGGRRVAVIDTPGLFDTNVTQEEVVRRIKMCISLSAPGPHAFLVVLQLGRFTQEEQETVKIIQSTFGEESARYTMVLFTHGDQLKKQTIEEFISQSQELKAITESCNGRYHVFNNEVKDKKQSRQLLDKIDRMTKDNGDQYYTTEMFMIAEKAIEKEKARLLKEFEAQKQKELEELRRKYAGQSLHSQEKIIHERYEVKARDQAERSNAFIAAPVIAITTVCGGVVGALIGICGGPVGVALGAAAGVAAGAAAGAAIAAVSIKISKKCNVQ